MQDKENSYLCILQQNCEYIAQYLHVSAAFCISALDLGTCTTLPDVDPHKEIRLRAIFQLVVNVEVRDDLLGSLSYVGQEREV